MARRRRRISREAKMWMKANARKTQELAHLRRVRKMNNQMAAMQRLAAAEAEAKNGEDAESEGEEIRTEDSDSLQESVPESDGEEGSSI